jgi:hypothetical protein
MTPTEPPHDINYEPTAAELACWVAVYQHTDRPLNAMPLARPARGVWMEVELFEYWLEINR